MTTQYIFNRQLNSCFLANSCVGKTDNLKRMKLLNYAGSYGIQRISTDIIGVVNIVITGLTAGSRVRLYNTTRSIEISNAIVAGTSTTVSANYYGSADTINLRVTYVSGVTAKLPFERNAVLSATGLTFLAEQEDDEVYISNNIDGSTVTEFTADFPNIQTDVNDPNNLTSLQRLYNWYQYASNTSQGIVYFFNGMTALDVRNYRVDVSVVDMKLQNLALTPCTLEGGVLLRSDGSAVAVTIGVGEASFNFDVLKAYEAQSTSPTAVQIRQEMDSNSTKLAHLDVDVSTRASQSSVDAIPTAGENANAVWDELLSGHTTAGSAGKTLKNTLSTNKFIGLK